MVRPDEDCSSEHDASCVRLAGGSPAAVGAGAPRSRLRVAGRDPHARAERREPSARRTAGGRGAKPQAQHQVNLAAPRDERPKGRDGRAAHFPAKATDCTCQNRSGAGRPRGMEAGMRRQPDTEQERPYPAVHVGRSGTYKPMAKWCSCREGLRGVHSTDDPRQQTGWREGSLLRSRLCVEVSARA